MPLSLGITAMPFTGEGVDYVIEAERLGASSVWVPEFWAYDAFTPLASLARVTHTITLATGIAQIDARTPAMLAMSSMSLQALSERRFVLGIGTSGPQVMEGWYGVDFSRPITRTRETIEIVRAITAGERLEHDGDAYELPRPGGLGRALRSMAPPVEVPIYVASLGPANLALTGAMADGWIGNSFFPETADVFFDPIAAGAADAGRSIDDVDLTVAVSCEFTDDPDEAGRRHADGYAFTFGAMGSGKSNFYNEAFARQGYGDDVAEVQRLWKSGDRQGAAARVPVEIWLGTNLIGPPEEITRRLRLYRDCGVDTLRVNPMGDTLGAQLDGLGQLLDLIETVNGDDEPG